MYYFQVAHRTYIKIVYILAKKINLKSKTTESIHIVFSKYNETKLDISNRKITRKSPNI